jgi:hypothetical protein
LLQNLLTQPRPGGLAGIGGQASQTGAMGSGIAGVASKFEGESIMVYATQTDFSKWEFIYDPIKFKAPNPNGSGTGGVAIGTPVSQIGSTAGMSNPGVPIGTGPGGTQAGGLGAPGASGAFGSAGSGSTIGGASGFNTGATGGMGSAGSTLGGSSMGGSTMGGSTMAGSTMAGSTMGGAAGSTLASGAGTGFGTPGPPDIRPGKK